MSNAHDPYKQAGVDTEKGDDLVAWLQSQGEGATRAKGSPFGQVVDGIGGFAGLFRPKWGISRTLCWSRVRMESVRSFCSLLK